MAQQNYLRNVPFNTYKLSDLISVDGNDAWTWPGRTLCGYISADNYENIIPLGSPLTIDTPTANLTGYWCLNKLDLSVYINNPSPDTRVAISGITHGYHSATDSIRPEQYNCRPLTDNQLIYKVDDDIKNNKVCKFWFNSQLICEIYPGENRTISAVWYDDQPKWITDSIDLKNHGEISSFTFSDYNSARKSICINEVISVYLAEGGIMHYQSNKNSINPYHPSLDD